MPEVSEEQQKNAESARRLAVALYPDEEWVEHEVGIYVAKSRLDKGHKAQSILLREIADARLILNETSMVYFLPDLYEEVETQKDDAHQLHPDTVINGEVVELKSVIGNRETLGKSFRRGYKQGRSLLNHHGVEAAHSVFMRIYGAFTVKSVKAKLAGELKTYDDKGTAICYFETTGQLYRWPYAELKALIGKGDKNHPAD
jgi:hypothetical protein